ncbi:MAG: hypothetical protein U9R17_11800, partial [Thermodesulfobacteriota bacterium]|nr:hypothetical protein [Thermodesulfobacteriota bacterium]
FEKYNRLLSENSSLKEENNRLKAQLGMTKSKPSANSITKIIALSYLDSPCHWPHTSFGSMVIL